jgi:hypothetical protein
MPKAMECRAAFFGSSWAEQGTARAKINPDRWEWASAQEMRSRYPVGEGRHGRNPTCLTSRQQGRRAVRGPARYRESEAGRIKRPGRVLRPDIGRVVGKRILRRRGRKPTACSGPEGRSPGGATASVQDTPGVSDQGREAGGYPGNVGEPRVSWCNIRCRSADRR